MPKIATASNQIQLSPILMDNLAAHPILIMGDQQKISLLAAHLDTILQIGELEHTGDWDPSLLIEFTDGSQRETETGYAEILFGDFNEEEQVTALKHFDEITSVGFFMPDAEDSEFSPQVIYYPLHTIHSITVINQ